MDSAYRGGDRAPPRQVVLPTYSQDQPPVKGVFGMDTVGSDGEARRPISRRGRGGPQEFTERGFDERADSQPWEDADIDARLRMHPLDAAERGRDPFARRRQARAADLVAETETEPWVDTL